MPRRVCLGRLPGPVHADGHPATRMLFMFDRSSTAFPRIESFGPPSAPAAGFA